MIIKAIESTETCEMYLKDLGASKLIRMKPRFPVLFVSETPWKHGNCAEKLKTSCTICFWCGLREVQAEDIFIVAVILTVAYLKACILLQRTLYLKWCFRITLDLCWIYSDVTGKRIRPIGCAWFFAPSKQFANKN